MTADLGWAAALAGLLGLAVGSFLNVVILRLPVMLERGWRREALEILHPEAPADVPVEPFNLMVPRSRCNACGHAIAWYENLPLLSWALLRGRCSGCGVRISARYPLVEALTGIASAVLVARHGIEPWTLAELVLLWSLIALAFIDFDTTLLPDDITLPLLWGGLLAQALLRPDALRGAVLGAALGYLSLWCLYHAFRLLTGKEGMGYGDFKLFAALGAWFGATALLPVIIASAVVGAVAGIGLQLAGLIQRGRPIPFGPFLAAAGIATLYIGPQRLVSWVLPTSA